MSAWSDAIKDLPVLGSAPPPVPGQKSEAPAKPAKKGKGTHRDRSLLDLAHEAPCFLQLGVKDCGKHPSVPCHSDMLAHGRGEGLKSHDALAVPGCPACHAVFTRKHLGKAGYLEKWAQAIALYLVWLWKNKKIQVV